MNDIMKAIDVYNAVNQLTDIYQNDSVCLRDIFATTEIQGLTIEQVVQVYAMLYYQIEEDLVMRINLEENSCIDLTK